MNRRSQSGLTIIEVLTAIVALIVIAAVAIPMWNTSQLRSRRAEAVQALEAVQKAQDKYFAEHARYALDGALHGKPPGGLGVSRNSARGHYDISVKPTDDGLGYLAVARAITAASGEDPRCVQFSIDQHGRRTALDTKGSDTSEDCWSRL